MNTLNEPLRSAVVPVAISSRTVAISSRTGCDQQSYRLRSAVVPVPESSTTVACQSSYTKVFASGGNFQDACGELIGVGQNRPFRDFLLL